MIDLTGLCLAGQRPACPSLAFGPAPMQLYLQETAHILPAYLQLGEPD